MTPTPTGNIVDNSAVVDYRLVIYGNSHSSQLGSIIETLISDQLPNKTIETVQLVGGFRWNCCGYCKRRAIRKNTWSHAIFQGQSTLSPAQTINATERLIVC